jgi:hypothetical protein
MQLQAVGPAAQAERTTAKAVGQDKTGQGRGLHWIEDDTLLAHGERVLLTQATGYIPSHHKHSSRASLDPPVDFAQEALTALWIDSDFPKLLGAELYRPHPTYVAELAIEPVE